MYAQLLSPYHPADSLKIDGGTPPSHSQKVSTTMNREHSIQLPFTTAVIAPPTRRRCHFPPSGNSALCSRHCPKYVPQAEADLTADFGNKLLSKSPARRQPQCLAGLAGHSRGPKPHLPSPRRRAGLRLKSPAPFPAGDRPRKRYPALSAQTPRPSGPIRRRTSNGECRRQRSMRR
jgi:hypothetical protein